MKTRSLRRQAKYRQGPGTPAHRFSRVMDELEKRWPDPNPFSAQAGEGRYFEMIDEERHSMQTALQTAITALNDWLTLYASEHCSEDRVNEAQNRVYSKGTIAYIADVTAQCQAALNRNKQNDSDPDENR